MGNMNYCRHENTANDLQDVVDNWIYNPIKEGSEEDDGDVDEERVLSRYEYKARERIIELAQEILENEGYTVEK